ncbi:MAG: hypothetical protein EOM59_10720 [Clostridia bacterium]|nr:hypothetical protein [Clostridia bacterium]
MAKQEQFYTPVGKIKFPKTTINDKDHPCLVVPEGLTEDDKTRWQFQLVVDPAQCPELLAELDKQHSAIKNANFVPYKKDKDKNDDGEFIETGKVAINFTSGYPIHMIDCMKQECHVKVGWGSRIKVQFTTKPVNNKGKIGLGRYPRIIQIIELKEAGYDTSGFEEAEGFTATDDKFVAKPWDDTE